MKLIYLTFFSTLISLSSVHSQSKIKAEMYCLDATKKMMKSISPMTGKDPRIDLIEAEVDSGKYLLKMRANWSAKRSIIFSSEYETFYVEGLLTVGFDGSNPSFQETSRNESVKGAWTMDDIGKIFVGVAALAAVADASSK